MSRHTLPPVDVWRLLYDGIEAPLRGGLYRGIKHLDTNLTEANIEHIIDQQHVYLMGWLAETFQFNDEADTEDDADA